MDNFIPNIYQKSIYKVDYHKLYANGIRCLLFDLDNTIVPVGVKIPNKKVIELIEELKKIGFKVVIFSNSNKKRLKKFKEILNVDCSARTKKPFKKKYLKIMKLYDLNESQIACVGDQLLTDIFGANKVGFTSILVNPVSSADKWITKFNRMTEKVIYNKLEKKQIFLRGSYYE